MTRQSVTTLREGGESRYRYQSFRSVEECNVAGRHVHHVNVQGFQRSQDFLHFRPVRVELFPPLSFPLNPSLVREIRWGIQPSSSKIQKERSRDDRPMQKRPPNKNRRSGRNHFIVCADSLARVLERIVEKSIRALSLSRGPFDVEARTRAAGATGGFARIWL